MMNNSRLTIISVYVIATLVILSGFFLLDIERVTINFWALGSLLFSLLVSLFVSLIQMSKKESNANLYYTAGLNSLVGIYLITIIISILFTRLFVEHINRFIFLQIALHALFLILALAIVHVSKRVNDSNVKSYDHLENKTYDQPKRGGF